MARKRGWLMKKVRTPLDLGRNILIVVIFVVGFIMSVFMAITLIFGDEELYNAGESDTVKVNYVTNTQGKIDLSDVRVEDGNYNGKPYKGFDDPLQQAMAKELLQLYREVSQKQSTLVQLGISADNLVQFLLGIHLAEVDTYTWKPPIESVNYANNTAVFGVEQTGTLIPATMVNWNSYGKTVNGKVMTFKNYNWSDFSARYLSDNPNKGDTSTSTSNVRYYSGFNYKTLRSHTGAIGPFQYQPATWNWNNYLVPRDYNTVHYTDYITDPENYVKTGANGGRGKDFNGDGYEDIYNLGDQALATLEWFSDWFKPSESNPTTNAYGVNLTDVGLMSVWYAFEHNQGSGNVAKLGEKAELYNKDVSSIIYDTDLFNALLPIYEKGYGHGSEEQALILEAYEKRGWTRTEGNGMTKTENGMTITLTETGAVYPIRTYFQGKSWNVFLQGIAYGNQANGSKPTNLGRNKVMYNYMTESNSKRNLSNTVRVGFMDERMAIGYKGNIPIYDQGASFMKQYQMVYPPQTGGTFYDVACTVFVMTSMHYSTGNNIPPLNSDILDINEGTKSARGYIDPIEYWGMGRQFAGEGIQYYKPSQLLNASDTGYIGTVLIRNILAGTGYTINNVKQGTAEGNAKILEQIKMGIPVHIRVHENKSSYKAIVPKTLQNDIDYNTFDLRNMNNYDTSSYKDVTLAAGGHSILGVDAIEINGEWHIGIVNSVKHHASGWDTNLLWFKASDLLSNKYPNGYSIVGSVDPNWKPIYLTGQTVPMPTGSAYVGVDPSVVLDNLENVVIGVDSTTTLTLTAPSYEGIITAKGNYKTKVIDQSTLRLYAGTSDGVTYALDFTGVIDPIDNNGTGTNQKTELFKIASGTRAFIKKIAIDSTGEIVYETFYDEAY